MNKNWLHHCTFLRSCPHDMAVELTMTMRPMLFAPGDIAPPEFLYVIERGVVLYRGKMLGENRLWGEDIILQSTQLRQMYVGRALTYVEVHCVSRDRLLPCSPAPLLTSLLPCYPGALRLPRPAAPLLPC